MKQEKEILKLGEYSVEREADLVGIKLWALHYANDVILFDYLGHDPVADLYFFKERPTKKKKDPTWVLNQPYSKLNTKSFHPFLLDMERIFGTKGY